MAVQKVRRALRAFRRAVRPTDRLASADDVRRAYRVMLGRDPESDAAVAGHLAEARTLSDVFGVLAGSPEFAGRWQAPDAPWVAPADAVRATDEEVIRSFAPYTGPGTPGFVTDFIGTRTRVAVFRGMDRVNGMVEGPPLPCNFHASAVEWAGALRAARDAAGRLVAVELGAGWGPWLVATAAAAARLGVTDCHLVGVEGSAGHVGFMRQHFRDNGFDPDAHTLLHGAAAAADGEVEFPAEADPAGDYGATLATGQPLLARPTNVAAVRLRAYSLPTLLAPFDRADLVHIDVQGTEVEVVRGGREALRRKVRRLVIGTHGRGIEGELLELLSADGWRLESEEACRYTVTGASVLLAVDGCQVWRNPAV